MASCSPTLRMKPDFNMKVSFAHNQAGRGPRIGHTWMVVIQCFLHADVSALPFLFSLAARLRGRVIKEKRQCFPWSVKIRLFTIDNDVWRWSLVLSLKFSKFSDTVGAHWECGKNQTWHLKCNIDLNLIPLWTCLLTFSLILASSFSYHPCHLLFYWYSL